MTRLYALCVLALLLYGLTVGCQAFPHPMNIEPGAHRVQLIDEGPLQGDRWGVYYLCGCPLQRRRVLMHEIYQREEISPVQIPA